MSPNNSNLHFRNGTVVKLTLHERDNHTNASLPSFVNICCLQSAKIDTSIITDINFVFLDSRHCVICISYTWSAVCDCVLLRSFITMFPTATGGATSNFDLRTLRAVRVLRPLKLVSGVPSLSRALLLALNTRLSLNLCCVQWPRAHAMFLA